jgi:hypothetical protein
LTRHYYFSAGGALECRLFPGYRESSCDHSRVARSTKPGLMARAKDRAPLQHRESRTKPPTRTHGPARNTALRSDIASRTRSPQPGLRGPRKTALRSDIASRARSPQPGLMGPRERPRFAPTSRVAHEALNPDSWARAKDRASLQHRCAVGSERRFCRHLFTLRVRSATRRPRASLACIAKPGPMPRDSSRWVMPYECAWSSIGFDLGLGVQHAPVARRSLTAVTGCEPLTDVLKLSLLPSSPRARTAARYGPSSAQTPRARSGPRSEVLPGPSSAPSHEYDSWHGVSARMVLGRRLPVVRDRCFGGIRARGTRI